MKRNYEKPVVYFESFDLSTSICGDCGGGINENGNMGGYPGFASPSSCAWVDRDKNPIMFLDKSESCSKATTVPSDGSADGFFYCYNKPGESMAMFSS